MNRLLSLTLQHDQDVVTSRQRAAQIAGLLGFDVSEQTRIATAVSEIVRNAFRYAHGGQVHFEIEGDNRPQRMVVRVQDTGAGIPHLDDVLNGRYRSSTGMGMGIVGAQRLMDRFSIQSSREGTRVLLEKFLPPRSEFMTGERVARIAETVRQRRPHGLVEEVQQQNQALLLALDELQRKQQELVHLNRELEDTNRGVVALYAELDEKADHLRRADELKSRFLSNMTHEFRTPVNSILGLCALMSDDRQRDGHDIEPEVMYIRKAAEQLSDLVNDLLDLAKVEAGKTVVRPAPFDVQKLFGALRGMLRPLLLNQSVALVFDEDPGLPSVLNDEGKVSQILRNLISNALKFTERGEVRVSASKDGAGMMIFTVSDTGIGIAPEDQQRIFEEFTQLEHRLQRGVRGTGLGLALSRRLAELLGGSLSVKSELGLGSRFTLAVPLHYRAPGVAAPAFDWEPAPGKLPLLIVDDADDAQYFYDKVLKNSSFQIYPAYSVHEAEEALQTVRPACIILDLVIRGEECWDLLVRIRRDERLRNVPVVVVSALPDRAKGLALGAHAYLMKPIDRRTLIDTLTELHERQQPPLRVLNVDDEEVARYLVRQCLPVPAFEVFEASNGDEGLRRAKAEHPDVILLDLVMPRLGGRETLQQLQLDAQTATIPVVIVTAATLEPNERASLLETAAAIVGKGDLSRDTLPGILRQAVLQGRPPQDRIETSI
jgi:signal transduction histidine kinase/DNA-binding response OmpR family regulator